MTMLFLVFFASPVAKTESIYKSSLGYKEIVLLVRQGNKLQKPRHSMYGLFIYELNFWLGTQWLQIRI